MNCDLKRSTHVWTHAQLEMSLFFQRLTIHITSCTSYTWKGSSQAEPAIKERANYLDMAKLRVILSSLVRKKFKLPQLPFFSDI